MSWQLGGGPGLDTSCLTGQSAHVTAVARRGHPSHGLVSHPAVPIQLTIVRYSCLYSFPELLNHGSATGLPSLTLLTACRVLAMVLRGICLMRPSEISWMYRGGVAHLQPSGKWCILLWCLVVLVRSAGWLGVVCILCSLQVKPAGEALPMGFSGGALTLSCLYPGSKAQLSRDAQLLP